MDRTKHQQQASACEQHGESANAQPAAREMQMDYSPDCSSSMQASQNPVEEVICRETQGRDDDARKYIFSKVFPALERGIQALNRLRPNDPLQFLADFFLSDGEDVGQENCGKTHKWSRLPVEEYLYKTLYPVVYDALKAVIKERPEQPMRFLAEYLAANKWRMPQTRDVMVDTNM